MLCMEGEIEKDHSPKMSFTTKHLVCLMFHPMFKIAVEREGEECRVGSRGQEQRGVET